MVQSLQQCRQALQVINRELKETAMGEAWISQKDTTLHGCAKSRKVKVACKLKLALHFPLTAFTSNGKMLSESS